MSNNNGLLDRCHFHIEATFCILRIMLPTILVMLINLNENGTHFNLHLYPGKTCVP